VTPQTEPSPAPGMHRLLHVGPRAASVTLGMLGLLLGSAVLWLLPSQTGAVSRLAALDPAGPGFFPLLAGIVAVLSGLACLAGAARMRVHPAPPEETETLHWHRGGSMALWLLAAGIGLHTVGMLSSLALLTAGLSVAFGERRPLRVAGLGLATALAIYLLFEVLLKILFPRGWLL
jgi:hypothetical protein